MESEQSRPNSLEIGDRPCMHAAIPKSVEEYKEYTAWGTSPGEFLQKLWHLCGKVFIVHSGPAFVVIQ